MPRLAFLVSIVQDSEVDVKDLTLIGLALSLLICFDLMVLFFITCWLSECRGMWDHSSVVCFFHCSLFGFVGIKFNDNGCITFQTY